MGVGLTVRLTGSTVLELKLLSLRHQSSMLETLVVSISGLTHGSTGGGCCFDFFLCFLSYLYEAVEDAEDERRTSCW